MTKLLPVCRRALLAGLAAAPCCAAAPHSILTVSLPAGAAGHVAGRMLIFVQPVSSGALPPAVDGGEFSQSNAAVAAQDVPDLAPGGSVDIDADVTAYPKAFSALAPGEYAVQAVLDTRRDYAYHGRDAGDLTSDVARITLGAGHAPPPLPLIHVVPARDPWVAPKRMPAPMQAMMQAMLPAARANARAIDFVSPALSAFWGRPIHMRGWVLLPPGYDAAAKTTYPVAYYTHGFGANYTTLTVPLAYVNSGMADGSMPPMIWVFLDESSPTGTHEFADSVNNGPWGTALTSELIPDLERRYRMDARPGSRFLNGHSSGGWATLWLQTRYPKIFGGTWSTSPDPSDFHDFTGIDLYAGGSAYTRPDGSAYPLMRDKGKVLGTFQQFAQQEAVLGRAGGQLSSFDWVFSPRGPEGAPEPMFNRATGAIDPKIVSYWHDHYDISYLVSKKWDVLKPDLTGKVHLIVGDADTFYLDGAAHKLQAVMEKLGAGASFTYVPGRTHFDLYMKGTDRQALLKDIAWAMYRQARPGAPAPKAAAPAHPN